MKVNTKAVRDCLKSFDFNSLFLEHLGWDAHKAQLDISIDDRTYSLRAVSQKRGFTAFVCDRIPDRATRLKIDHQVTKSAREHFIVYADKAAGQQVWQWVRREPGKPLASRDHRFEVSQSGAALVQRLERIAVSMEEEEELTLFDVTGRNRAAFDVDKVTKRFYDRFKAEHTAFLKLISGFPPQVKSGGTAEPHPDLQWYTSLMLNRLMFVYFIQKKGFLDGDTDYLRNRLNTVKQANGPDKFQSFYRYFLLRLFHDGLGKAPGNRRLDPAMEKLLGRIPYLNGGFFEVHKLERDYADIEIPDVAFVRLFDFFDQYNWHLDERPLRKDDEINPDVVGYIFEKYINQKQMGAYYTKEDITEYISKNTIIPYLFDAAKKKCAIAFKSGSALWRLLADDPDRYIYASVRQGVVDEKGDIIPLPADVEAGIADVSKRDGWNRAADAPYALPTETWREHVARRQRCLEIREKLRRGEVEDINDLITLNLDIWQFARDVIVNAEGTELVRAFWQAIQTVTVLDPTCGSGAFVFAALRILETLYSDCLERMERFVEDDDANGGGRRFTDFRDILAQIAKHPNERYFILKSIIINNLFGVDIMEEAVEICKLRLFLKLVAQVETFEQLEPLPDVDFNIRAGNTLVGYTSAVEVRRVFKEESDGQGKLMLGESAEAYQRFEEKLDLTDRAFLRFRQMQTEYGMDASDFRDAKDELLRRRAALDDELNLYMAKDYGISEGPSTSACQHPEALERHALVAEVRQTYGGSRGFSFVKWLKAHQPFHWFVHFYGIMAQGGFDVIIGNPPYIAKAKVRKQYGLRDFATEDCSDIYANILERAASLLNRTGRTGMIVPLSLTFSGDFASLRELLFTQYIANWFSSFARIPAALFSAEVRVRNTIHIGAAGSGDRQQHSTVLHRWFEAARPHLFGNLRYASFTPVPYKGLIPKIGLPALSAAYENCFAITKKTVASFFSQSKTTHVLHFKKSAYNWLNFCRQLPPCFDEKGRQIEHTQFGTATFRDEDTRDLAFLFLNGKIMYVFWAAVADDFHVTEWMFADFPIDFDSIPPEQRKALLSLASQLESNMQANTSYKLNAGKKVGNFNLAKCRSVTNASDLVFAAFMGLTTVWQDIELTYAQIVRTDFVDENESKD